MTISGVPSARPVSLLMAMMGSTMPSSLMWRRSLMIRSSTTSVRDPESMQTRPTVTRPALRAPSSSISRTSPLSISMTLPTLRCIEAASLGVQFQLAVFAVHGNEILRLHQVDDQLQFFLAGVSADVDRRR